MSLADQTLCGRTYKRKTDLTKHHLREHGKKVVFDNSTDQLEDTSVPYKKRQSMRSKISTVDGTLGGSRPTPKRKASDCKTGASKTSSAGKTGASKKKCKKTNPPKTVKRNGNKSGNEPSTGINMWKSKSAKNKGTPRNETPLSDNDMETSGTSEESKVLVDKQRGEIERQQKIVSCKKAVDKYKESICTYQKDIVSYEDGISRYMKSISDCYESISDGQLSGSRQKYINQCEEGISQYEKIIPTFKKSIRECESKIEGLLQDVAILSANV